MTVTRFGSDTLFDGGFAYGSRVRGEQLFTAGISPLDEHGAVVAPGDLIAQTAHAVELLSTLLAEQGGTVDDIAKLTVYVETADRAEVAAVWGAVEESFTGATPPAVIVAVTVLPYPGQRIEIDAVTVAR
ncbi:MAG: RidA family protein [Gordonia sp. (in: high G+C Gram-positive bacteria)]|jgi:enamine deaminase RidA (YjgF/YER057c/UK114 family)|nr:RidA family protein [Gordonia sp. (in: high G+C Gram-positive bacteria)]